MKRKIGWFRFVLKAMIAKTNEEWLRKLAVLIEGKNFFSKLKVVQGEMPRLP